METKPEYITESQEALEMSGKGYNNDPVPPNEFIATISGFTLAPDAIINEYGYVTALVWGVTWRFCQMSDGVCRASLEKIGARLGMSERTIIRHLETLCNNGYLFDTTPNLKNKPHIYADTGKIKVKMNIEAGVTESQRAMTESQRQGDRESVEESIKKQVKKQKINGASAMPKTPTTKATDFPELVLHREVVKHWCKPHQREIVISAIQKINTRLGRLAVVDDIIPFWQAWGKVSGNDWSLVWLDWAVSGKIPQQGSQQTPANNNFSILQAFASKG
jgi:DNA-binding Lrp family transcriptional regulator